MAGQDGEHEAAREMCRTFVDAGLDDPSIQEFDIPGWWRRSSQLVLTDPAIGTFDGPHEVIALPGTSSGEVTAELVDVGYGDEAAFRDADLEGNIAMVSTQTPDEHHRWIHRMEKYTHAVESGATGFVFRNHVPGCLPPTGEVGYYNRPAPIPAVGVSKELGERLLRTLADTRVTARLSVDCENDSATSSNVYATVGPETDREILVTAHHDAHDIAEGARDNGAGCALVAGIGHALVRIEDQLDTRVRLMTFGAEELALNGSTHYAATADTDRIRCVVNIDGSGASSTPSIRPYGFDEMTAVFETVADSVGGQLVVEDGFFPYTDAWPFVEQGIPAVTVGSDAGTTGRGWAHTQADTLDKLDPRDLRALAVVYLDTVIELATGEFDLTHQSSEAVRSMIDESGRAALEATGRWSTD